MLEGNILEISPCHDCSQLSQIKFYCFNCPRFMCFTCEKSIHGNIKHEMIEFMNVKLRWDNSKDILDLFEDKVLGKRVFEEINRKVELIEEFIEVDTKDQWQCKVCSNYNTFGSRLCEICYIYRETKKTNKDEYEEKLMGLTTMIKVIENGLREVDSAPFEHVAKEYINSSDHCTDFNRWFHEKYLAGKALSLVSEVVNREGHGVTADRFAATYSEVVKDENQTIMKHLPPSLIMAGVNGDGDLIELREVNKCNKVSEDVGKMKVSVTDLWEVIIQDKTYTENQSRMIITEMNLPSLEKLDLLRAFIRHDKLGSYLKEAIPNLIVEMHELRQALVDYMIIDEATNFLMKPCSFCYDNFPMSKMQSLLTCPHEMCKTCFSGWIQETIERKSPRQWCCPFCPEENLKNIDWNLHIYNIRKFLKENENICPEKYLSIFEEKLLNDPLSSSTFRWCCNLKCQYGFDAGDQTGKVQCQSCKMFMCLDCRKEWTNKHDNKTCQEYDLLMNRVEPKVQEEVFLKCPSCNAQYELAPGGCLHFDCKCGFKFCGGCFVLFTDKCKVAGCTLGAGFHGHHPRNCIYFLRDYDIKLLEKMLETTAYPKLRDKADTECIFIDTVVGTLKEEPCKKNVYGGSSLCEYHYKEYLIQFICKLQVDPADFVGSHELNLMLLQALVPKLETLPNEDDAAFVDRLKKEVKKLQLFTPK